MWHCCQCYRIKGSYSEASFTASDEVLLVVAAAAVAVRVEQGCLLLRDGNVAMDHFLLIPDPEVESGHFRRKLEQRKPELLTSAVEEELQVQVLFEEEVQAAVDGHQVQETDGVAPAQEDALNRTDHFSMTCSAL